MTTTRPAQTSADLAALFSRQKAHHPAVRATTAEDRIRKLQALRDSLNGHRTAIQQAIFEDFRKPPEETDLTELSVIFSEIDHACKHLKQWMRPSSVHTPLKLIGTRSEVHYEPLGNVLIIAPWNYPFNLTIGPLVSAVAAGNCVILKPSEYTPKSTSLLKSILSETFAEEEVAVVEGAADQARALLEFPFDHIFFTGSTEVGRKVMSAAATHLASVTLELGGKSPVVVDPSADLQTTAERIVFGKFSNAGQTCIAPDYILVHADLHDALLSALRDQIQALYPDVSEQPTTSQFTHIVSDRHFERLTNLLDDAIRQGARLVAGGQVDAETRFIAPTILADVADDMRLMHEEIFGPLLPVIPYSELDEALACINGKPGPLALYIFSRDEAGIQAIQAGTASGGVCINDTLLHFAHPELPFGGVNQSGIGKSHGHYGFLTFSNERAVLHQRAAASPIKLLYPPFTRRTRIFIDYLLRYL